MIKDSQTKSIKEVLNMNMRNKLNHTVFACLLCVTLLFAMGFGFESRKSSLAGTSPIPANENDTKLKIHIADSFSSPINQPAVETAAAEPLTISEPSSSPAAAAAEQLSVVEPPAAEGTAASYEITAYYLNVRAEADAASRIVNVVSKGKVLEVVRSTENGWLELKSGGYIHGGYAKLISEAVQAPSLAVSLSEVQTVTENFVVQAPEPALQIEAPSPSKPSSAVKSNSGLTEAHIAKIIKNTALEGEGLEEAILEIERTYGINSYFTIAVMKLESGHGKSQIAKTKNNLFGLNALDSDAYNNALSFKTKGESVKKFGHIISEYYIEQGLTSVEKVAGKYCGANSNWPVLVKSIMNSDYKKIL
jgi:flagellum-specific peptidoglycan hydrolase FlgJ